MDARSEGPSIRKIADRVGISPSAVHKILQNAAGGTRKRPDRGAQSGVPRDFRRAWLAVVRTTTPRVNSEILFLFFDKIFFARFDFISFYIT